MGFTQCNVFYQINPKIQSKLIKNTRNMRRKSKLSKSKRRISKSIKTEDGVFIDSEMELDQDIPIIRDNCQINKEKANLRLIVPEVVYSYTSNDEPKIDLTIPYIMYESNESFKRVEYEADEEDLEWIKLINVVCPYHLSDDSFEFLIDRVEKRSFWYSLMRAKSSELTEKKFQNKFENDAVCSICMDGDCSNSNAILFCDWCNVAVHQECYGVPYVPEGQWLCRLCIRQPNTNIFNQSLNSTLQNLFLSSYDDGEHRSENTQKSTSLPHRKSLKKGYGNQRFNHDASKVKDATDSHEANIDKLYRNENERVGDDVLIDNMEIRCILCPDIRYPAAFKGVSFPTSYSNLNCSSMAKNGSQELSINQSHIQKLMSVLQKQKSITLNSLLRKRGRNNDNNAKTETLLTHKKHGKRLGNNQQKDTSISFDNLWAHIVCALWIPEVSFGNTVFLEPIDNIDRIPWARWRLTCYICGMRNAGACIQCARHNCYTAFHVTCAQLAGLYMVLDLPKTTSPFYHQSHNKNNNNYSKTNSSLTSKRSELNIGENCTKIINENALKNGSDDTVLTISSHKKRQHPKIDVKDSPDKHTTNLNLTQSPIKASTSEMINTPISSSNNSSLASNTNQRKHIDSKHKTRRITFETISTSVGLSPDKLNPNNYHHVTAMYNSTPLKISIPNTYHNDEKTSHDITTKKTPNCSLNSHSTGPLSPGAVKKLAYCHLHTPTNLTDEDWSKSWSIRKTAKSFTLPVTDPYFASRHKTTKSNLMQRKPGDIDENTVLSSNKQFHEAKGQDDLVSVKSFAALNASQLVERARQIINNQTAHIYKPPPVEIPDIPLNEKEKLILCDWNVNAKMYNADKIIPSFSTSLDSSQLDLSQKVDLVNTIIRYWKLKRMSRNGFSLLKIFDHQNPNSKAANNDLDENPIFNQLNQWITEENGKIADYITRTYQQRDIELVTKLLASPKPSFSHMQEMNLSKQNHIKNESTKHNRTKNDNQLPKVTKTKQHQQPNLTMWQSMLSSLYKLRQDLEKLRLLVELIRKREKLKKELLQIDFMITKQQVRYLALCLERLLVHLELLDSLKIFHQPVDTKLIPQYLDIIKSPMDFSTMRRKIENHDYTDLSQFSQDFDLMIANCKLFNPMDTIFYKVAVKLQTQSQPLFQQAEIYLSSYNDTNQTSNPPPTDTSGTIKETPTKRLRKRHINKTETINPDLNCVSPNNKLLNYENVTTAQDIIKNDTLIVNNTDDDNIKDMPTLKTLHTFTDRSPVFEGSALYSQNRSKRVITRNSFDKTNTTNPKTVINPSSLPKLNPIPKKSPHIIKSQGPIDKYLIVKPKSLNFIDSNQCIEQHYSSNLDTINKGYSDVQVNKRRTKVHKVSTYRTNAGLRHIKQMTEKLLQTQSEIMELKRRINAHTIEKQNKDLYVLKDLRKQLTFKEDLLVSTKHKLINAKKHQTRNQTNDEDEIKHNTINHNNYTERPSILVTFDLDKLLRIPINPSLNGHNHEDNSSIFFKSKKISKINTSNQNHIKQNGFINDSNYFTQNQIYSKDNPSYSSYNDIYSAKQEHIKRKNLNLDISGADHTQLNGHISFNENSSSDSEDEQPLIYLKSSTDITNS